jgi:hypothetical protein
MSSGSVEHILERDSRITGHLSLYQQIEEAKLQLSAIERRESEYVSRVEVPIQLLREKQRQKRIIEKLESALSAADAHRGEAMNTSFLHGYAVVVGVGADLPVTARDAQAVFELLTDQTRCAYSPEKVQLLVGERAIKDNILKALDEVSKQVNLDPDATCVIYFSGHGVETPDYYLLPFGYDLGSLDVTCIAGIEFTQRLRKINAKKMVVLLDCCHAGGITEAKGRPITKSPLPADAFETLKESTGSIVIASSRKDEYSYTGNPYSVFTMSLLEAFAGYGAFEADGYSRVLDIALWVGRKVPERTDDNQHPIVKVSNLADNFAVGYYAAGGTKPKNLAWTLHPLTPETESHDTQTRTWRYMLDNYRENLLLIEERMSQYVTFTSIPLQLVKDRRELELRISDLERNLGLHA